MLNCTLEDVISQFWSTGKSLSEALIFASTNQQYDDRLFIVHENCKLRIPAEHFVYTNCCFCFVLTNRTILVPNMFCRCCQLLKKIYLYHIHSSLYCVNMTVDLILKNDNQGPPNVTIRLDFFDLLASVNLNGLLKNWRQQ